jgi:coenzyme F420-0:L-glutamate ligase/coenzyme F420-1:gamma-L-glutamate ligase
MAACVPKERRSDEQARSRDRKTSRGAAQECSPRRQPWDDFATGASPEGAEEHPRMLLPATLLIIAVPLADEVKPDDLIVDTLLQSMRQHDLSFEPGDILVVKHKIVSKAEGRIVDLVKIKPSADSIAWAKKYNLDARVIELSLRESRAVIRRKNGVLITETRHGFICANSGVDVSNVDGGRHAVLLPADPDRSARELHRALKKRTGLTIPVLITDSFGRPWREGLADFCIGIAGMKPLRDDRGQCDPHGYTLHASLEAIADELAAAAGLVCGKLTRTPACIVRGFNFAPARGSTRQLLRPASNDLFR